MRVARAVRPLDRGAVCARGAGPPRPGRGAALVVVLKCRPARPRVGAPVAGAGPDAVRHGADPLVVAARRRIRSYKTLHALRRRASEALIKYDALYAPAAPSLISEATASASSRGETEPVSISRLPRGAVLRRQCVPNANRVVSRARDEPAAVG